MHLQGHILPDGKLSVQDSWVLLNIEDIDNNPRRLLSFIDEKVIKLNNIRMHVLGMLRVVYAILINDPSETDEMLSLPELLYSLGKGIPVSIPDVHYYLKIGMKHIPDQGKLGISSLLKSLTTMPAENSNEQLFYSCLNSKGKLNKELVSMIFEFGAHSITWDMETTTFEVNYWNKDFIEKIKTSHIYPVLVCKLECRRC